MSKRAQLPIALELLHQLIDLPTSVRIIGAEIQDGRTLLLVLESEHFTHDEGQAGPLVSATMHRKADGQVNMIAIAGYAGPMDGQRNDGTHYGR